MKSIAVLDKTASSAQAFIETWAGVIIVPCALYMGAKFALSWSLGLKNWLAIAATLPIAGFIILFAWLLIKGMLKLNRASTRSEAPVAVGMLLCAVVVSIVGFAGLSYALTNQGWISFDSPSHASVNFETLTDFFSYEFVDAIPGIRIWSTFNVHAPATATGFWAPALLLCFRLSFIAPTTVLLVNWRKIVAPSSTRLTTDDALWPVDADVN